MEPMAIDHALLEPHAPRCLEQRVRADHVRLDEGVRTVNGPIDVRLGSEMHDGIDFLTTQQLLDQLAIANISADEAELGPAHRRFEICRVACVRERIQDDQRIARMLPKPMVNEVGANEAGAAGDEESRLS
jgi:hypothetical protein